VITRWTSIESVRAFAGPDVEQAVVAEEAAQALMRWACWAKRIRNHRCRRWRMTARKSLERSLAVYAGVEAV
jgi:hypothetical protein